MKCLMMNVLNILIQKVMINMIIMSKIGVQQYHCHYKELENKDK